MGKNDEIWDNINKKIDLEKKVNQLIQEGKKKELADALVEFIPMSFIDSYHKTLPYLYQSLSVKEFLKEDQLLDIYKKLVDAEFQEKHIPDALDFCDLGKSLAIKIGNKKMQEDFEASRSYYGMYVSKGISQYIFEARDAEKLKNFEEALKKYEKALNASTKYNQTQFVENIKMNILAISDKVKSKPSMSGAVPKEKPSASTESEQKTDKKTTKKTKKSTK